MTTPNEHNNAPAAGILDRARWGGQVVNLMRLAEAADKAVASMTVPAPEAGSESKIVIDVGPGGSGGGPAEAAPPATEQTATAPAQERCSTCGYLTSEREHLGCLRRAVKDLDIATGGPYDAQEVAPDPNGWCQYVAGMVFCWLQMQKELPNEDQCVAAIAGIIGRRLWAYKPAQEPVMLTDAWLLEQFKHHPNWELSTSNDPECDPNRFWLVHEVKGGRNDREWFLLGEGATPRHAIIAALREKGGK